jgi:cell shape-determining protein MreD
VNAGVSGPALRMRPTVAVVSGAVFVDALMGAVRPGNGATAVCTIATVVAIAQVGGVRRGMVAGFATGMTLDLLAGPASVLGVQAITGLLVGAAVGAVGSRTPGNIGAAVLTAVVAVPTTVVATAALRALAGPAEFGDPRAAVALAVCTGLVVTPVAARLITTFDGRPLPLARTRA